MKQNLIYKEIKYRLEEIVDDTKNISGRFDGYTDSMLQDNYFVAKENLKLLKDEFPWWWILSPKFRELRKEVNRQYSCMLHLYNKFSEDNADIDVCGIFKIKG